MHTDGFPFANRNMFALWSQDDGLSMFAWSARRSTHCKQGSGEFPKVLWILGTIEILSKNRVNGRDEEHDEEGVEHLSEYRWEYVSICPYRLLSLWVCMVRSVEGRRRWTPVRDYILVCEYVCICLHVCMVMGYVCAYTIWRMGAYGPKYSEEIVWHSVNPREWARQ